MFLPFASASIEEVFGQILFTVLVFSHSCESSFSPLARLFDHVLLEAALIIVIANPVDALITVSFILEQVMSWKSIA